MEAALFSKELMMEKASLFLLSTAVPVILPSDLQLGRPLGKGSYGEVYYSQWQGADTAVKQLYLSNLPVDLIEEFQQEAVIIANCQHPNIVRLYGICTQQGVKKDPPLALTLLEPLAEEGEAQSQYFIGLCYLRGLGVMTDAVKGKAYLQKAAAQGHAKAEQQLTALSGDNHPVTLLTPPASPDSLDAPAELQQKNCVLQ